MIPGGCPTLTGRIKVGKDTNEGWGAYLATLLLSYYPVGKQGERPTE
jgi:hypothetical protein